MNFLRTLANRLGLGNPLSFAMQRQEQTEWCWSATSVSVNLYFNASSGQRQCSLVNAALGQTTCCTNGGSDVCNQPWYLDRALRLVNNFQQIQARRATLAEIRAAIDSGRPLCLRIGWNNGGGHFVAVHGYSGTTINIADPWYGSSAIDYSSFPEQYQDGGQWTHIYWVKP
jgi:hypothetical protein